MRLLHLVGSAVDDFHADLSRLYARGCLEALAGVDEYESVIAHVDPDGGWSFPSGLDASERERTPTMGVAEAFERIAASRIDAVVPQLFDLPGMTVLRSAVEALGLPLLGNSGAVMGIAADKALTKALVRAGGVATPDSEVVTDRSHSRLAPPVVVKPLEADNSQGVTLVTAAEDLDEAIASAQRYGRRVLVERFVPLGREVRCGVLERDGELLCLPLEEYRVDPVSKPIRDSGDKLASSGADLRLVAKDDEHAWIVPADDPIVPAVHAAARAAHRALGCRHYGLFDFRIDPDGTPWFLEAGLYCSFSPRSVLAVMAAAAGIDVQRLFADVLARTLREHGPVATGAIA